MKKIITIIVCAVCLISCTKEGTTTVTPVTPPTPNPGNPAAGSFTWKENGVAYTADSAWYYTTTRIVAHAGAGANMRFISISLNNANATTPGVFSLPPTFFNYSVAGPFSSGTAATAGTLTVTNYDNTNNRLTGTFTNVTTGSYTLTDGVFTNLPKR